MEISKIQRMQVRDVWKDEAKDFTPWLKENIDDLSDVLGLSLTNVESEQAAGPFSVDLVAEDEAGRRVIIENQLKQSDHEHLGKVITYLTALEAKVAVWITTVHRPEHLGAIVWLNETSLEAFYLVRVEAIKIGDSAPAALFTVITGPSEESKIAGAKKKAIDQRQRERERLQNRFWADLLEHAADKTQLHAGISPGKHNHLTHYASLPAGFSLVYRARNDDCTVELYIDAGPESDDYNRWALAALREQKAQIEDAFGEPLDWNDPVWRYCAVRSKAIAGGVLDEAEWPHTHAKVVDKMIALDKAVRPHLSAAAQSAQDAQDAQ